MQYKIQINEPITVVNFITNEVIKNNNDILKLDFKNFVKTIIYPDARWDLNLATLKMLLTVRDKVNASNNELILNEDEYKIICEIIKQPTSKYNHLFVQALIIHIDSILNASLY